MSVNTKIEWCDSTINPQMGCDGCELWTPKSGGTCYAAALTERWGGVNAGFPERFDEPRIYPKRIAQACGWSDLTGKDRPEKPWLNGLPRTIFLDDLGDTFTEKLDGLDYLEEMARTAPPTFWWRLILDAVRDGGHWLEPFIPAMEKAPHIWILLTKRPTRMRRFFERMGRVPRNFWLMTSITSQATVSRARELIKIPGAMVYGLSIEPIWGDINLIGGSKPLLTCPETFTDDDSDVLELIYRHGSNCPNYCEYTCNPHSPGTEAPGAGIDWLILGGESGRDARTTPVESIRSLVETAKTFGAIPFVKQLGVRAEMLRGDAESAIQAGMKWAPTASGASVIVDFKKKGGDMELWPEDLRIRQVPRWRVPRWRLV